MPGNDLDLALRIRADVQSALRGMRRMDRSLGSIDRRAARTDRTMRSLGRTVLRLGAAYLGIRAAVGVIRSVIGATEEQAQAVAQVELRLRNLDRQTTLTSAGLQRHAMALQQVTTTGDEAVLRLQALLLTFRNIDDTNFNRVTEAALDMAAALGQAPRDAALQLAKALEDPREGLTALRRSGTVFSVEQTQVIRRLVETNRAAEAQALILEEVERQYRGAARAQRETLGGAGAALGNAFGDLLEVRDGAEGLRVEIEGLTTAIKDPGFASGIRAGVGLLVDLLAAAVGFAGDLTGYVGDAFGLATGVQTRAARVRDLATGGDALSVADLRRDPRLLAIAEEQLERTRASIAQREAEIAARDGALFRQERDIASANRLAAEGAVLGIDRLLSGDNAQDIAEQEREELNRQQRDLEEQQAAARRLAEAIRVVRFPRFAPDRGDRPRTDRTIGASALDPVVDGRTKAEERAARDLLAIRQRSEDALAQVTLGARAQLEREYAASIARIDALEAEGGGAEEAAAARLAAEAEYNARREQLVQERLDAEDRLAQEAADREADRREEAQRAILERERRIRDQLRDPREEYFRNIADLQRVLSQGGAGSILSDEFETARGEVRDYGQDIETILSTAFDRSGDALGTVLDTGETRFRAFVDALLADSRRLDFGVQHIGFPGPLSGTFGQATPGGSRSIIAPPDSPLAQLLREEQRRSFRESLPVPGRGESLRDDEPFIGRGAPDSYRYDRRTSDIINDAISGYFGEGGASSFTDILRDALDRHLDRLQATRQRDRIVRELGPDILRGVPGFGAITQEISSGAGPDPLGIRELQDINRDPDPASRGRRLQAFLDRLGGGTPRAGGDTAVSGAITPADVRQRRRDPAAYDALQRANQGAQGRFGYSDPVTEPRERQRALQQLYERLREQGLLDADDPGSRFGFRPASFTGGDDFSVQNVSMLADAFEELIRPLTVTKSELGEVSAEVAAFGAAGRGAAPPTAELALDIEQLSPALTEMAEGLTGINLEFERNPEQADRAAVAIVGYRLALLDAQRSLDAGIERGFLRYVQNATDSAAAAEDAVTGALGSMEDAVVEFATTGKFSFSGFVDSVIADLARIAIRQAVTVPLAAGLAGLFGGGGIVPGGVAGGPRGVPTGAFFQALHTGGVAGALGGVRRAVPPAIFAGAERYHAGGIAGLRPNEVPILAERGETISTPEQIRALGSPHVEITFENRGTAQREVGREVRFDPRGLVVTVVTDDLDRNGPISQRLRRDPLGPA